MDELEYSNILEITPEGNKVCDVNFKPMTSIIGTAAIGIGLIVLCVYLKVWGFVVFGVILVILAALIMIFLKDFKTMSIYEKGVVVYKIKDETQAAWLPFDQIREFSTKIVGNGTETLYFILEDGRIIYVETFASQKAYSELFKIMPEKETREKKRLEERGRSLTFKEVCQKIIGFFTKKK